MPGDVAERRGLVAPLGDAALRLALEVDEVDVVLRHQHLAEMIVAVDARLEARRRRGRPQLETRARIAFRALWSAAASALASPVRPRRAPWRRRRGRASRRGSRPSPSASTSRSVTGSALKARSLGRRGEGGMQLGRAAAEHAAEVERMGEGRRRRRLPRRATARVASKSSVQRVEHDVPRVALVPHEGEDRGERHRLALRRHVFGGAEEGRRVPEAGDLGEEARHRDLRLLAVAEPPVDLHDRLVADDEGDVALLDADAAERRRRGRARGAPRCRSKRSCPPSAVDRRRRRGSRRSGRGWKRSS